MFPQSLSLRSEERLTLTPRPIRFHISDPCYSRPLGIDYTGITP